MAKTRRGSHYYKTIPHSIAGNLDASGRNVKNKVVTSFQDNNVSFACEQQICRCFLCAVDPLMTVFKHALTYA